MNCVGALSDPYAEPARKNNGTSPKPGRISGFGIGKTERLPEGCRPIEKKFQAVNLYPTPRTEWKCRGARGSGSKYLRKPTMKLSTVRVVGNTL